MELLDEPPAFPTLPFVVGDIALIGTALGIALRADGPLTDGALIAVVVCVALGACLLAVPFILNYSRRQDAKLDERQAQLARLTELAANAAEQASIAASGLHDINQQAAGLLKTAQTLSVAPTTKQTLPAASPFDADQLMRELTSLRTTVEKSVEKSKAVVPPRFPNIELPAAIIALPDQIEAIKLAVVSLQGAVTELAARESAVAPKTAAKERSRPAKPAREKPEEPPGLFPDGLLNTDIELKQPEDISALTNEAPPLPSASALESPIKAPIDSGAEEPESGVAESEADDITNNDKPEPTIASPAPARVAAPAKVTKPKAVPPLDDASAPESITKITATAYIGIGNKLFVRGEGPGLSPDKGIALQFVSIGKWRWESNQVTEPLRISLWKNDEIRCETLGEIELSPGSTHEVTASF